MRMAAIYARVSSDQQREANTIASQTSALIEFAQGHDLEVPGEWVFEDDGYTGATLERPGLERVRDLAAEGQIQVVLAYSPDRLSRKYAYQILLMEELARNGVETMFVKAPQGASAEDQLLVQFQGMISEYERAQIWSGEEAAMSERHALQSIPTKILLPLDFSPSSQAALETAADLALHFHAELFLVNVLPLFSTFTSEYAVPQVQFQQEEKTRAEQHLAKVRAVLTKKGVKAGSSVEVANDIAGCIMEVAEREHVDFVVISTHGISGWHPLVFGSIAEKVIKLVQYPLLLLRSATPETGVKTPSARSMEWW